MARAAPLNRIGEFLTRRPEGLKIILFVLALLAWPFAFAQDHEDDRHSVGIEEIKSSQHVRLVLVNDSPAALTLFFELTGSNFNSDRKLPLTLVVDPYSRQDIVQITQSARWESMRFSYRYSYQQGDAFMPPDEHARYILPFEKGTPFIVAQSPGSTSDTLVTHNNDYSRYAFDFGVPVGTLVTAAREGVVVGTKDTFTVGRADPSFSHKANFVAIMHADRSIASYVHLAPRRVLVKPGQYVHAGTPIAYSGNTGYTFGPHLHFDVRRAAVSPKGEVVHLSVPVNFYQRNGAGKKIVFEEDVRPIRLR